MKEENGMSDRYVIIDKLFTEEGITHQLDQQTDMYCRERGFLTDPTFNEDSKSRALRNYFEDGRFYEGFMTSPAQISSMEKWIESYKQYLKEDDLKAVIAHYEKMKEKLSK